MNPTQNWTATQQVDETRAPEAVQSHAQGAPQLWLPPSMRPPPAPDQVPKLIIPERFGRPRTEAEHRYYRNLIAETKAMVEAAKADKAEALDDWIGALTLVGTGESDGVIGELELGSLGLGETLTTAPEALDEIATLESAPPPPPEALVLKETVPAQPSSGAIVGDPNPGRGAGEAPVVHREADGFEVNAPGSEGPALVGDAAVIKAGMKAEVRHRKQIGGTCGLYALGMVMDFWHDKSAKHPTALIQKADLEPVDDPRGFVHFHHKPTDDRFVLDVALDEGFTAKGEMYQAEFVAETATRFGYDASLRTEATLDDVYQVLDAGHPAIVAFNVDRNGEAGTPDSGARAHYAVLQGYFDHEGERYVVAKHSWSKTQDRVWRAQDFFASWDNLKTTKFYGTPGDGQIPDRPDLVEPKNLTLPDAGNGRADISKALARTLVEVVPPGEDLTGGRRFAAQAQGD